MAQKTIVELTDDLDGSEASETVIFGLRGVEFEIDLSEKNAAALDKALGKYIGAARKLSKVPGRPARRTARSSGSAKEDIGAIREWAQSNGYEVSSRGRIPGTIREAFEATQR